MVVLKHSKCNAVIDLGGEKRLKCGRRTNCLGKDELLPKTGGGGRLFDNPVILFSLILLESCEAYKKSYPSSKGFFLCTEKRKRDVLVLSCSALTFHRV